MAATRSADDGPTGPSSLVQGAACLSLVWMTVEGVIGTVAGIVSNSIALIGYGLDSTIAGVASLVIIWRFTGDRLHSQTAERQAQRVVAISFFLVAPISRSRRPTD